MREGSPAFEISLIHSLKGAGLRGLSGTVSMDGDALRAEGEEGGVLLVPARDVERLRLNKVRGHQGVFYEARIWRMGHRRPFLLIPDARDRGYAAVMRDFAFRIAAAGGWRKVHRGESRIAALIILALSSGSLAVLAIMLALYGMMLRSSGFWFVGIGLGCVDMLIAYALWRRIWPRSARGPADLDPVLPDEGVTR